MECGEDHSLIDLDTHIELKCTSIPLVPLPKSDSPFGKELLCAGDNPFDNTALEAMSSENDPFEFFSKKAVCRSKEFKNMCIFEEPIKYVHDSYLRTELYDITIENTGETNYKLVENVDLLSHLKSVSKSNITSARNPFQNQEDNQNLSDKNGNHKSYSLTPHTPESSENWYGHYLKQKNCDVENSASTLAPFPNTSQELSPASFVKTRVRKCIAEAKKGLSSTTCKTIDFSPYISSYNRRRSLDSLKHNATKSSPYAHKKKYRKSLDMTVGGLENTRQHFPAKHDIREDTNCQSKEFKSESTTSCGTTFFRKYFESNHRTSVPEFSSLKNYGERSSPIYRSLKEEQHELEFVSKIENLDAKLVHDKRLSEESSIEFTELESDEETNIQEKKRDEIQGSKVDAIQYITESRKVLGNHGSPTIKPLHINEKKYNEDTSHLKSTKNNDRNSLQKCTGTPKSNRAYVLKNILQRTNSVGRIETRKAAKLNKKKLEICLRSRSDGSICNKSYKHMNEIPSPISPVSKQLLKASTPNAPPIRSSQKRHLGRITKPLKSLGKVLQQF